MRLFARECHKIAKAEGDVLRQAAKKPARFVDRMSSYYGGEFHMAVCEIISPEAADGYAQRRMQDVLSYADGSAQDLVSKCEQDSAEVRKRARALINLEWNSNGKHN